MRDPHPPDAKFGWRTCTTPSEGYPGDTYACPECKRAYFAVPGDEYGDGEGTFRWLYDTSVEQPPLPAPEDD